MVNIESPGFPAEVMRWARSIFKNRTTLVTKHAVKDTNKKNYENSIKTTQHEKKEKFEEKTIHTDQWSHVQT